jgi:cobalt/nickel transport system ATP-binding protein
MNAITVRSLSFAYHDGTRALNNVSFSVAEGECVGIIGPSGAGKSTLLLHLNGILPERLEGEAHVTVFGNDLSPRTVHTIRREAGLVFQNPDDQLFCPTVAEDVAFGPEQCGLDAEAITARVRIALAQTGLEGFDARSPHHLSQGEKRRVCLAGVLACQPRILLLDEPTSSLDPRARRELIALVRSLRLTTLIATHDLGLVADLCSRVIVLDHGTVAADGPAHTILDDATLMEAHGLV